MDQSSPATVFTVWTSTFFYLYLLLGKSTRAPVCMFGFPSFQFFSLSFTATNREISGGLDSTAVTPQYRRGGCPTSSNEPECSDSHELETLMPSGSQETVRQPGEAPEEQSLMVSVNLRERGGAPAPEPVAKSLERAALIPMGHGSFLFVSME